MCAQLRGQQDPSGSKTWGARDVDYCFRKGWLRTRYSSRRSPQRPLFSIIAHSTIIALFAVCVTDATGSTKRMSDPKGSAPPIEEPYYASSYQQGSNAAAVAPAPGPTTNDDEAIAQRLQQEEFRNVRRQQQPTFSSSTSSVRLLACPLTAVAPRSLLHCCAPLETL